MIQRRGLPTIAWVVVGLLFVAAFATGLGQQDLEFNPSVTNYAPSGVSAFYALLKKAGYDVVVDRRSAPKLGPHDVALCFTPAETKQPLDTNDEKKPFEESIAKFLQSGGRVINFTVPEGFANDSKSLLSGTGIATQNSGTNRVLHVLAKEEPSVSDNSSFESVRGEAQELWTAPHNNSLVWLGKVGAGKLLLCESAYPVTNRFIDKADDADFVLSLVDTLVRPGDRLVLTEASFSAPEDPGFFETIGSWATAAWRQILVLVVVIIYSLGRRFGYAEERRKKQEGAREIVDAVADVFKRGRKTDAALAAASEALDLKLRSFLRIPRDASQGERDRLLPENVTFALSRLTHSSSDLPLGQNEALEIIQVAEREVDNFLLYVTRERSA